MEDQPVETTETATTEAVPEAPAMADGILQGSWEYIWAAYILTWGFLLGYAIYVNVRREMVRVRTDEPS